MVHRKIIFIGGFQNTGTRLICNLLNENGFVTSKKINISYDWLSNDFHDIFYPVYKNKNKFLQLIKPKIDNELKQNHNYIYIKHGHLCLVFDLLKKYYPSSICILCIRNPLDSLLKTSYNYKKYAAYDNYDPPLKLKFEFYRSWYNENIIDNTDYIIKMEDLIFNPKKTISYISENLDILLKNKDKFINNLKISSTVGSGIKKLEEKINFETEFKNELYNFMLKFSYYEKKLNLPIENRLLKNYTKLNLNSKWCALLHINNVKKNIDNGTIFNKIKNLGRNDVGKFLNASVYHDVSLDIKKNVYLKNHIKYHKNFFLKLNNMNLKDICIPDILNIYGEKYKSQVIPVTSYRIGYYASKIIKILKFENNPIILEIGSGWGLLPYIIQKKINATYIIVDIPTTSFISAYVLSLFGINPILETEYKTSLLKDNKNKCIFLSPDKLDDLPKNSCDIVINTASLAEMPVTEIEKYLTIINKIAKYYYFDTHDKLNYSYIKNNIERLLFNMKLISSKKTPINAFYPSFDGSFRNENWNEFIYQNKILI